MLDHLDRYFAHEASDYLDQLVHLLSGGGAGPDVEPLLSLCGGVRGSAQMAGAESVAAVAERLEEGLRSVQEGQLAWSEEVRRLCLLSVRDLEVLVRASGQWSDLHDPRVVTALSRWAGVGGSSPVDVEALFFDDEGPHVLTPDDQSEMNQPMTAAAASEPVPIESLLLDRHSALMEALSMRDSLERAIREVPGAEVELGSVVRELFELLEVAAAGVPAGG